MMYFVWKHFTQIRAHLVLSLNVRFWVSQPPHVYCSPSSLSPCHPETPSQLSWWAHLKTVLPNLTPFPKLSLTIGGKGGYPHLILPWARADNGTESLVTLSARQPCGKQPFLAQTHPGYWACPDFPLQLPKDGHHLCRILPLWKEGQGCKDWYKERACGWE